jgi:hypothetical protein
MRFTRGTEVPMVVWRSLPTAAREALVAIGRTPETLTLGDVRSARSC